MSAATRQRRYRARRKAGRRVITLEVDEVELAIVLESLNFLNPMEEATDAAVQRALSNMIRVLSRGL
jgi:ubiquinone biosynthesis protein UbiJ